MKLLKPLLLICVVLLAVVLVVAGADGGGDSGDEGSVQVTWGKPPTIEVEEKATPPKELVIEDLRDGDGEEATDRDEVTVHFAGVKWNGQPFESSWDGKKAEPFNFILGASPLEVSPGWDQGIRGMREGGRRVLTIPPELLYPPGQAPDRELRPNETEIYVIELVKVEPR